MTLQITILGCGSSGGVPRVGGDWGACDPSNPKNRRRRCSILVERIDGDQRTVVLVDTSPDLREQLLATGTTRLDGILITHAHADHARAGHGQVLGWGGKVVRILLEEGDGRVRHVLDDLLSKSGLARARTTCNSK